MVETGAGTKAATETGLKGPMGLALVLSLMPSFPLLQNLNALLGDTDDAMRLVQVRALLDGRSWWDLVEPRLGPPDGLLVHWSRLIDGPIAALMWICQAILGPGLGELAARALWPLLILIPLLLALLRASRTLGGATGLWFTAAITPLCWYVEEQFAPGRLDHHNVQLALMAWNLYMALDSGRPRNAAIMGALAGLSLAIGFETLPVVVWAAGLIAARYVFTKSAGKAAVAFGLALAASTALAFVAQTPPSLWTRSACDALGLNMAAGATLGGFGLAAAARFVAVEDWRIKALAAGGIGAGAVGAFLALHPICLHGPYAEIDPRIIPVWLDRIGEAQPALNWLRGHPGAAISGVLFPSLTALAALFAIARGARDEPLLASTGLLLLCALVGFIEIRGFMLAQAAAIPLAAALIVRIDRVRLARPLTAGLVLGLALSPQAMLYASRAITKMSGPTSVQSAGVDESRCLTNAAMDALKRLPAGLVLADLDAGPNILALTHHSAVGAPYHRLGQQIYDVMTVFNAPIPEAAAIVAHERPDYIAVCREGVVAADNRPHSFGAALLAEKPPPWLAPIPARAGDYALFRVRRDMLWRYDGLRNRLTAAAENADAKFR